MDLISNHLLNSLFDKSISPAATEPQISGEEINAIRAIESRSFSQILFLLSKAGIEDGSGEYRDYERGKRLLFGKHWINPDVHRKQILWICWYVGLDMRAKQDSQLIK